MTPIRSSTGRRITLLLALFLAGCQGTSSDLRSQLPAWRDGIVLAESASLFAPAIGPRGADGWLVVWTEGAALLTRTVTQAGISGEAMTLIRGRQPWNPALYPGVGGKWHLLWHDLDEYGQARLFGAHLGPAGELLRGPVPVTPEGVSTFAAYPGDSGTLVLLWAQAALQPNIYGQSIDPEGRPVATPPALLARSAEHPVLARAANGTWVLGWLAWPESALRDSSSREVIVTTSTTALPWQEPGFRRHIATLTFATPAEFVDMARLGLDLTHGYLLVSRQDAATNRAWTEVLGFTLVAPGATIRSRLTLPASPGSSVAQVETGFNSGLAYPIPPGLEGAADTWWPQPGAGQHTSLPVALATDRGPAIAYFEAGQLRAFQPVNAGGTPSGSPGLWVDRDRHLTLAWALPRAGTVGTFALILTSTRPAASR